MAAMDFPATPTVGQRYPDPMVAGVPQYKWDGTAWLAVIAPEMIDYVKRAGDTMTGLLTLSADPTADMHSVTKRYVDGGVAGLTGKVSKGGDSMSGALRLGTDAPFAIHPFSMLAGNYAVTNCSILLNAAYDTAGVRRTLTAGYAGEIKFNPPDADFGIYAGQSVAAGADTTAQVPIFRILPLTGIATIQISYLNFNVAGDKHFQINGSTIFMLASAGGAVVFSGSGNTFQSLAPLNAGGYHSVYGTGQVDGAGVFGYQQTIFGGLAFNVAAQGTWSFYGNGSGMLPGGAWAVSDGNLKAATRVVDGAAALAHINAIPVKSYTSVNSRIGTFMQPPGRDPMEEQIGWVAQDIEPYIPAAVTDVQIPKGDLSFRAALLNRPHVEKVAEPNEQMSDNERFLREAEAPVVKATNLSPMVAELWAAVQELSKQNTELKARLDALSAPT